ncbi:MAG: hypothetical protein ACR2J5_08745 [Geodermatophilaceae bacterium]
MSRERVSIAGPFTARGAERAVRRSRASQELLGGADGLTAARCAFSPPGGSEERRRLVRGARHDTAHEAGQQ